MRKRWNEKMGEMVAMSFTYGLLGGEVNFGVK